MAGFFSLLRRLYLTAYNFTLFVGWYYSLSISLTLKESGHGNIYHAAEKPLLFAQTAAVLEVFWSKKELIWLVRSPVTATLPQIGSRLYLLWGILWSFPEIIRYFFFGLKEAFGFAPSWLLWLRYSAFLVLYPTGITSEVGLIYIALPFIKASEKYCIRMPNKWNFSFDYFSAAIVVLGIYVPGMNSTSFSLLMCALTNIPFVDLVALTCIVTCLHRGRKLYRNQRKSRIASI
ncbi:Very-long-chain (3R)-3-hydroxyacyl-CoA dehydratase PASTICCINO 2A, partial [Mucuna pruriens]